MYLISMQYEKRAILENNTAVSNVYEVNNSW